MLTIFLLRVNNNLLKLLGLLLILVPYSVPFFSFPIQISLMVLEEVTILDVSLFRRFFFKYHDVFTIAVMLLSIINHAIFSLLGLVKLTCHLLALAKVWGKFKQIFEPCTTSISRGIKLNYDLSKAFLLFCSSFSSSSSPYFLARFPFSLL